MSLAPADYDFETLQIIHSPQQLLAQMKMREKCLLKPLGIC